MREHCTLITLLISFTFAQIFTMRCTTFITLLLFLLQQHCLAQRNAGVFSALSFPPQQAAGTRDYFDTLKAGSFIPQSEGGLGCATGIYPADTGYVSGNNTFGDLQKAQFFSLHQMGYTAPGYLQDVQVMFGKKIALTGTSVVYIKLYATDTAGFWPGNLIAVSTAVPINDILAAGEGTNFHFIAPVMVGDSFFVSVALPTEAGDTLAVLSSIDDCRSYTAWSWEQWANGTWHAIVNAWVLDIDLAIFPVIDLPFNVGTGEDDAAMINSMLTPNPAGDQTTCCFTLGQSANVTISLLNEQGRLLRLAEMGTMSAGTHMETLDLKGLPAGTYYILLNDGKNRRLLPLVIY